MGKTINKPSSRIRKISGVGIAPAQRAKKNPNMRAWIEEKMKAWEKLSPAERARADAEWELVEKSMKQARIDSGEVPLP